ncbi:MAG: hypothetical protein U0Z17_02000 [Bacteroidales bacterium]
MVAMNATRQRNIVKQSNLLAQSRTWPENLGVGKPYDVDERLPDFLSVMHARNEKYRKGC